MAPFVPSLSALRAFEAVSRFQSFTRAASELFITQAAVSWRVKELERQLGAPLFDRQSRTVTLTEAGRIYLPIVRDALQQLSDGAARVAARRSTQTRSLRVLATQAFTSLWLMPRLDRFRSNHPELSVQIITWIGGVGQLTSDDFDRHGVDATILMGKATQGFPGLAAELIAMDYAIPVAHPDLGRRTRRIVEVDDLRHHVLLHADTWSDVWPRWLAAAGAPGLKPAGEVVLPHAGLTVHAAMSGLGVAVAHGPLVADEIAAGTLVAPFPVSLAVDQSYFFVCSKTSAQDEAVSSFRDWVRQEMIRGAAINLTVRSKSEARA